LKTIAVSSVTRPATFVDTYKDSEDKLEVMLEKYSRRKHQVPAMETCETLERMERMGIVEISLTKPEFIAIMKDEFAAFVTHVERAAQTVQV
jgi:hypothetical protein